MKEKVCNFFSFSNPVVFYCNMTNKLKPFVNRWIEFKIILLALDSGVCEFNH